MRKWVSTNEMLPELGKAVLCRFTDGRVAVAARGGAGAIALWHSDSVGSNFHVTHWMPLPEPPEEVKTDVSESEIRKLLDKYIQGGLAELAKKAFEGSCIPLKKKPFEAPAIEITRTNIAYYDVEEIHENCTVQVLKNTQTGGISVGWWENE